MTADQRARVQRLLSRGCGLPAARDHARLMLTIDERRQRATTRDLLGGFAFIVFLCLLSALAEGVGNG